MAVTVASFRSAYPEFVSATDYPDATVTRYITVAYKRLPPDRWDTLLDDGVCMYVAHNLVMDLQNRKAAALGSVPGQVSGAVASKSVGGVSVSYDTGNSSYLNAGYWNFTSYGRQFWELAALIGAGGLQISGSDAY